MTITHRVISTTLILSAGFIFLVAAPRSHAHYRTMNVRMSSRASTIRVFEYALQKSASASFARFAPPGALELSYFAPLDEFGSDSIPPAPETKKSLITPLPAIGRNPNASKFDAARYKLPTGLQILQTIDSSGSRVRIQERIDSINIGVPSSTSLDDYLAARRDHISKKVWDSLVTVYDLKKAMSGDQLSKLLSQATNVAIPLPPNPLTSIFGKPEISINVNGEVNVRGGWRWDSQNLGASSAFGQSQSSPIFTQDIQINVSGRIGDKLRLGTDWSTRRQFEFDNRFRIGYDGYDDDIIKKVELGNVQMQNNSAFISSSQALFGVRADFQFGPLFLKSIASQRRGERRFVNVNGGSSRTRFVLRGYDYAPNHFFLDTNYKPLYRNYWRNTVPVVTIMPTMVVKGIEVYESSGDVQDQAVGGVEVIAYADLDPIRRGLREFYPSTLKAPDVKIEAGKVERGRFLRLPESRFLYDANLGTLSIQNMRRDRTYAVAYRTEGATNSVDDDLYTGTMTDGGVKDKDTLILKLMYRPNLQPGFKSLWARQMRNIYFINATNVNPTDARINVFYLRTNNDSTDVLEGASEKIVTALGVDRVNNGSGQTPPDGVFDFIGAAGAPPTNPNPGGGTQGTVSANAGTGPNLSGGSPYFNPQRGEITFPSLEPFREGLDTAFARRGNIGAARQFYFGSIYDNQVELARQQTAQDRWLIVGEVQGQLQGRIPLGFNIAPGSVKVRLDGRELRENDDYTVEYISGVLTLRNAQAQVNGANLNVEYESNDIMNVTTKTLAGVRADMSVYKTRNFSAAIGSTYMHYDQAAIIDRVRIGEEPVSNSMIGFDGQMQWNAEWLTKALDALPFFSTKEKSIINFRGEWAMQLPTPNKRQSEIPEDQSAAVAYLDDFESAQRSISLGLAPTQWQHASPPIDSSIAFVHRDRGNYRGQNYWYQYFIGRVPIVEVYPKRNTVQGRSNLSPLIISFDPSRRGIYNPNPQFIDTLNPRWDSVSANPWQVQNKEKIWGGFQRLISSFNSNFDLENIDYIEMMMKVDDYEPGQTKMFIDLGQISEDVIPNLRLNTEDGITTANPVPNGRIDPGEDVGIDAWDNALEKVNLPYPLNLEDDPSRDDYRFNFTKPGDQQNDADFVQFNSFEGNSTQSELGQFPDTEVLNRQNGQTISLDDSYFSYEVNLDGGDGNPQVVGSNNGWRLFRIPLRGLKKAVGNPLFSNIQYVRVWYKGGRLKAQIVDWRFAGAQWQRLNYAQLDNSANVTDNTLRVQFVNREENDGPPDFYTMPPGVQPPRNLANPDFQNDIRLNEQSISIGVNNLSCGDQRLATRFFRTFDMFFYRKLKFFVKGVGGQDFIPPDSVNLTPSDTNAPQFVVRFGTDTANYYEYRAPIVREWKSVSIDLTKISAIKSLRDSLGQFTRLTFPVEGEPLARYAILGNPVLTRIQYVSFGIANPGGRCPRSLSTTVWVDELRVIEPLSQNDWATTGEMSIKLADLGNVRAAYTRTNPFFHRLEERFGNRDLVQEFSFNFDAGFEKFLPKSWKDARIPFAFTRITRERNPQFQAQNDVNVEEAAALAYKRELDLSGNQIAAQDKADLVRRRANTAFAQTSFSVTGLKTGIPSDAWYVRETINRITFSFNYFQESEQSPVVKERFRWQWDFAANYAVNIPTIAQVKTGGWMDGLPLLSAYKDWKINFLPQTLTLGTKFSRWRRTEQSWFLPFPTPAERQFTSNNTMAFQWKLTEGGLLSPVIDYTLNQGNTLVPLELDELGRQLSGADVSDRMFFNDGRLVNFGTPSTFSQNFTMNFRPRLPEIGSINKFFESTGSFSTVYTWFDPLQTDPVLRDLSKQARTQNNIRLNSTLRLRGMTNSWFGITAPGGSSAPVSSTDTAKKTSIFSDIIEQFRSLFFDYETVTINFTQTNAANTPGVFGGTGFSNLFGRAFTGRGSENFLGPSAAYQLGLTRYPHSSFRITPSSKFPFFGFEEEIGIRPPNAQMQDNFTQRSNIEMRTSRPLWKGATLDLSWRSDFGINRNQLTTTDAEGRMTFSNVVLTEQYNRSFLTLPNFLIFSAFNNTPENVVDRYRTAKRAIIGNQNEDSLSIQDNIRIQNAMTDAFIGGLQAFEFFPGLLSRFLPQLNWTLRWEGIEKYWFFGSVAQRVSFEHTYQSTYTENARINDNGRTVDAQTVQMAFQPLIGLNFTFDEKKVKGTLTGSLRYNTRSNYALAVAARTLSQEVQNEFQMNASYVIRGFTFPLFGFELKNDVEFSLNTQYRKSSRFTYALSEVAQGAGGNGGELNGQTNITIEPRARYTLSNRVTASAFYRYVGTFSTGAANPGFSTTEVGLEFRLAISGGR